MSDSLHFLMTWWFQVNNNNNNRNSDKNVSFCIPHSDEVSFPQINLLRGKNFAKSINDQNSLEMKDGKMSKGQ